MCAQKRPFLTHILEGGSFKEIDGSKTLRRKRCHETRLCPFLMYEQQLDALERAECDQIFTDKASGVRDNRIGLLEAVGATQEGEYTHRVTS